MVGMTEIVQDKNGGGDFLWMNQQIIRLGWRMRVLNMSVQIIHTNVGTFPDTSFVLLFSYQIVDCILKIDDPGYKRKQVYVKSPML